MLLDHQKAMQEDQERRDAREAAKAEKDAKKKRKSDVPADDDVEMDDIDADEIPETKKSAKKRKKDPNSDDEEEKVWFFRCPCADWCLPFPFPACEDTQNRHETETDHPQGSQHDGEEDQREDIEAKVGEEEGN